MGVFVCFCVLHYHSMSFQVFISNQTNILGYFLIETYRKFLVVFERLRTLKPMHYLRNPQI